MVTKKKRSSKSGSVKKQNVRKKTTKAKKTSGGKRSGRTRLVLIAQKRNSLRRIFWSLAALVGVVAAIVVLTHLYLRPQLTQDETLSKQEQKTPAVAHKTSPKTTANASKKEKIPAKAHVNTIPPFEVYPLLDDNRNLVKRTAPPVKPHTSGKPRVAIIIDDIGYDARKARNFINLIPSVTISILPHSPYQQKILEIAAAKKADVMLHMPMEPKEYPRINPGPGALLTKMPIDVLIAQLNQNLDTAANIKGINNHMGSRLTENPEKMHAIFSILKKRNLFFVDSVTTSHSYARSAAKLFRVPFAERNVFLDHQQNAGFIKKQARTLVHYAKKRGAAIGIGHPYPITYETLQEVMPWLKKEVALVPVKELVHIEE